MTHEPIAMPRFDGDNLRPFPDIPEVGYSVRHESWLMHLSEAEDGLADILAEVESFTMSGSGSYGARGVALSEHTVHGLLSAGIRIGIARERLRAGYDESGPVKPDLVARLDAIGADASLTYTGVSWRCSLRLRKPDGSLSGSGETYGATQEAAVVAMEIDAATWREFWERE